jgi:hypothetical protein
MSLQKVTASHREIASPSARNDDRMSTLSLRGTKSRSNLKRYRRFATFAICPLFAGTTANSKKPVRRKTSVIRHPFSVLWR